MTRVAPALALALCALFLLVDARPTAAAPGPGEIEGDIPPSGGLALVMWGGGDVNQVAVAAQAKGCDLRSLWIFVQGKAIGYVPTAPPFVNAPFLQEHPSGVLPAGVVLLACGASTTGIQPVAFAPVFGGRVFDRPIELVPYPASRFLVAEQDGRVLLVTASGSDSVFLTLNVRRSGTEEGLLSVALDPAFATNGHLWVYYSPESGDRRTRLSRISVQADVAQPSSELVVLEVAQPFSNHNGGAVRFGPDGMLYLGLGDGGSGGDPQGNGQDTGTLLGSIIRIDVRNASTAQPYVVPSDNPFASGGGRGEIWAYGFRNPWRMAFDGATLWAGDVGQSAVEEIDVVTKGGNYGWARLEGDQCYQPGCSTTGTILPVATYTHSQGCSVTGGVVARSAAVSQVNGAYLYADYCSGRVWAMDAATRGAPVQVGTVDGNPSSFALGPSGEAYLLQFGGPILRIVSP